MTKLKQNVAANFFGSVWSALMSLIFIPLYIHFLGIEAYGLVGFFVTLQAVLSLLDMGLSATLNRELARLSAYPERNQEMLNLVRTLEIIYWIVAVLISIIIFLSAPIIARYWLKPGQLPVAVIERAIFVMGLAIMLRWPLAFYSGGMQGLQRQVLLNIATAGMSTLQGAGAVLALWLISPSILTFCIWQTVVSGLYTLTIGWMLWRSLPSSSMPAVFKLSLLKGVWRFTIGMSGIAVTVLLLTQLDKIILSKMLTLKMFGYYSLASMMATALYYFIRPIFNAFYPRLTQLVSQGSQEKMKKLYHTGSQLMSILLLPSALVVCFFSKEILLIWTQNSILADQVCPIASVLIIGTAINGLMNMPYALQLAYGWTKLAFCANSLAVVFLVPLTVLMTKFYGPIGAATVWVVLNLGYLFIALPVMHMRLLKGEQWTWYLQDVGLPLVGSLLVVGFGHFLFFSSPSPFKAAAYIALILVIASSFSALMASRIRIWLFQELRVKFTFGRNVR